MKDCVELYDTPKFLLVPVFLNHLWIMWTQMMQATFLNWILMEERELMFCEKEYVRKNTTLAKITTKTQEKYVSSCWVGSKNNFQGRK